MHLSCWHLQLHIKERLGLCMIQAHSSAAPILLFNAAMAFGLNMSVFLLIGKTSALTVNVAGVVKDWLLIVLSILIFKTEVKAIV